MGLSKPTILELGTILQEDLGEDLEYKGLEKLAYSLVGYFDLLIKANHKESSEIISLPLLNTDKKDIR